MELEIRRGPSLDGRRGRHRSSAALLSTAFVGQTAHAQATGEIRGRIQNAASDEGLGTVVIVAQSPAALGDQFGFCE